MKQKFMSAILAGALAAAMLAGCGTAAGTNVDEDVQLEQEEAGQEPAGDEEGAAVKEEAGGGKNMDRSSLPRFRGRRRRFLG